MIDVRYIEQIARELAVRPEQVTAAIQLLTGGATMPFVARYRKDVTGNLDEVQLETIAERNNYFIGLMDRRKFVLDAIEKQGQLTDELRAKIESADDKTTLEDLYLPFKKARRTKATVAKEQGLEPLADLLWDQAPGVVSLEDLAAPFVQPEKGVESALAALGGAGHILAERIANAADVRQALRGRMLTEGKVVALATKAAEGQKTKFEAYYEFSEPVKSIPSHRFLAICRGEKEGVLRMDLALNDDAVIAELAAQYLKEPGSVFEPFVRTVVEDAYKRLLRPSIETEVIGHVRERSEEEAVHVFRENAENLLLAPPAGRIRVIGIDPGMRTGCKLAIIDDTGHFIEHATIFPNEPQNDIEGAGKVLAELIVKHDIRAVAIGNGTGARETARFAKQTLAKMPERDIFCVFVNEAGASVYSASKVAREEFPQLDVTIRGAISIARRLQDPLAELVKIEPRSIGVGQYQHDVNQKHLREGLQRTVSYCVNRVGVDVNTASVALLRYVSGIQSNTAENIVAKRTELGGFASRQQLLDVDGVGPRVFEQCAGFLRINAGIDPLDSTAIHPEAYDVVEKIAGHLGVATKDLIGNAGLLKSLDTAAFQKDEIGSLTLQDICQELLKPGRDPRTEFKVPTFREGVDSVQELEEGMDLEGVVTNVTDFGAFVDIGVHHDGLVHLSELSNRYVQDPRQIVKVGEIVQVRVIKVDKDLPRISLSMKVFQEKPAPRRRAARPQGAQTAESAPPSAEAPARRSAAPDRAEGPERPVRRERPSHTKPHRKEQRAGAVARKGTKASDAHQTQDQMNTQLADQLAMLKEKFRS